MRSTNNGFFQGWRPEVTGAAGIMGLVLSLGVAGWGAELPDRVDIGTPKPGDHALRILTPNLLELFRVNTKLPDPARVNSWDWVNGQGQFVAPDLSSVRVIVNGQTNAIIGVGFKRRVLFAPYSPLFQWEIRVGNHLYLRLANPIAEGASVQVTNNGTVWPTNMVFAGAADPWRFNPGIHVNQEGYLPGYPKKAVVGYYLGNLGEMVIPTNRFHLVNAANGAVVHQGTLTLRPDVGYRYEPGPYQLVYEADFSGWTTPGEYRVAVPGMGASLPFRVDEGVGMAFARTHALQLYQQRSGMAVGLPFTRFGHAADHVAPAAVPTNGSPPFIFTWYTVSNYTREVNPDNPPQTAPVLTNYQAQLFPFVRQGTVQVSGGHFEAGDYNRVTYNGAQLVHLLVFAADALPGVAGLDNLGIPESGDGISDALQEAKWEADFLARMQDTDGGFFYSVYPRDREYEIDVLPENGDPQVVWPKNTATTAAAVAALAQCASSPRFKAVFPQAASNYLWQAKLGWSFLSNAIARFGFAGAYQRVQHFDDNFTHHDDLAWAACELFLATGDSQYETRLLEWFPDPSDYHTFRWGWQRMFGGFGNAIRSYAFGVPSGRLAGAQVRSDYLARCHDVITNSANDLLRWSQENAYGTSFPDITKAYRDGGWYFSTAHAFDLITAYQISARLAYVDAFLRNLNYEAGANPVNVSFITGLGWKRQRNVVDQYSMNDHRKLPRTGIPVSNITAGFRNTWFYGWELGGLSYPSDYVEVAPYPYYDRWGDDFNVSTEGSTTDTARSFVGLAWLAAQTAVANQAWRFTSANLLVPGGTRAPGQPVTVSLNVADADLNAARIMWEARGQEPGFGGASFTFSPGPDPGIYWVEAEVQWPDGRRAFAVNSVTVSGSAGPQLAYPQRVPGGFSFTLAGVAQRTYIIEASSNLTQWSAIATNTISSSGTVTITDVAQPMPSARYYRAVQVQ